MTTIELCRRSSIVVLDLVEVQRLVGEGRVVFVDVTAARCLTCKVNEAAVLDREPVASRLFVGADVLERGPNLALDDLKPAVG